MYVCVCLQAASAAYHKDLVVKYGISPSSDSDSAAGQGTFSSETQQTMTFQEQKFVAHLEILQTIQENQEKKKKKEKEKSEREGEAVEIRESSFTPSSSQAPPPPPSLWQQATTPEGHTYYYNVLTRGKILPQEEAILSV